MMARPILIRFYDSVIRDIKLVVRYYTPISFGKGNGRMVFKADGRFPHGGMFDRLKGAVSVFAASQCIDREFKISFTHPFDLRKYLMPNEYDWTIDDDELLHAWPKARPIFMYGEYINPKRLIKKRSCESHFYYGYNSLNWLNRKYNKNFEFGKLYNQLFKPTDFLQQYIDAYKSEIGDKYVVTHFRFMNLIGDCTEFSGINPVLVKQEQDILIEKSLNQIKKIVELWHGYKLMLATDSPRFTSIVENEMPDVYIVPGEIKHIGTAKDNNDVSNVKVFIDYYLMAEANKVYSFVSDGMWKSAFPEYAAKIGQKPFERVFY